MSPPRRIGLYGGSFDPVHLGHLLVARAAQEELALDRLILIPTARSPFKPNEPPAPAAVRLRLLRLAFAGWPRCELDPQEIVRGGTSYTVETLRRWRARFPEAELFWLIGADHVPSLPRWREAEELARLAEFVVVPRPGQPEPAHPPPPFRLRRLRGFPLALSASAIRKRIRAGQSITPLVPPAVAEAISRNGLYLRDNLSH